MRSARLKLLVLLIGVATFVTALLLATEMLGVGFFDQEVVLESSQPIERVSYFCGTIDEATRREAENTANPKLFEWDRTCVLAGGRFTASIIFTTRSGCFHHNVYYPPHLVLLVEFADGTRGCRVVDLPRGRGKVPVVVRFG
jgi:hypothetical protein